MRVNECIDRVNKLKDNAFDKETIKQFIEDCDKQIFREVVQTHYGSECYGCFDNRYPLSGADELIADDAYCQLYIFYAISQVDIFNGDTERYQNNMICYNSALSEFRSWYNRTHKPKGRKRIITG